MAIQVAAVTTIVACFVAKYVTFDWGEIPGGMQAKGMTE